MEGTVDFSVHWVYFEGWQMSVWEEVSDEQRDGREVGR